MYTRKRIFTHVHTTQRNTCAIASSRHFRLPRIDTCSRELCVRMCIRAHAHTLYIYIHTHIYIYKHAHTQRNTYTVGCDLKASSSTTSEYMCWATMCTYVYIYACTRAHTHYIYTHKNTCIYIHTHTQLQRYTRIVCCTLKTIISATNRYVYGVATISRLLRIIGLSCKRAL